MAKERIRESRMMKILFICGSLEPGRDGVGDYTLKLTNEFIKRGYGIVTVSLFDRYISDMVVNKQENEKDDLSVTRLPSRWSNKQRYAEVKHLVQKEQFDWIILQYVPFGYASSGLPFSLISFLQMLKKTTPIKLFIFFHEVFIECSLKKIKYIPLAVGQYIIARKLFSISDGVATSIDLYAQRLSSRESKIPLIPIGSNIGEFKKDHAEMSDLKTESAFMKKPVIATFGVRNHELLIQALQEIRHRNFNVHLLILGQLKGLTELPEDISEHVTVTGFLPEKSVMQYLQAADLFIQLNIDAKGGINNKSGSLAAAFAAGLPIIGIIGKITNSLLRKERPCIFISSISELPSAVIDFFKLPDGKREEYHMRSKKFYDNYLTWGKIVEKYINILNSK